MVLYCRKAFSYNFKRVSTPILIIVCEKDLSVLDFCVIVLHCRKAFYIIILKEFLITLNIIVVYVTEDLSMLKYQLLPLLASQCLMSAKLIDRLPRQWISTRISLKVMMWGLYWEQLVNMNINLHDNAREIMMFENSK